MLNKCLLNDGSMAWIIQWRMCGEEIDGGNKVGHELL